jgi:hypothetical protein
MEVFDVVHSIASKLCLVAVRNVAMQTGACMKLTAEYQQPTHVLGFKIVNRCLWYEYNCLLCNVSQTVMRATWKRLPRRGLLCATSVKFPFSETFCRAGRPAVDDAFVNRPLSLIFL